MDLKRQVFIFIFPLLHFNNRVSLVSYVQLSNKFVALSKFSLNVTPFAFVFLPRFHTLNQNDCFHLSKVFMCGNFVSRYFAESVYSLSEFLSEILGYPSVSTL